MSKLRYTCHWCDRSFDAGRKLTLHCTIVHDRNASDVYTARFPGCRTTCVTCQIPVKIIDQDRGYPERCSRCNRKRLYAETPHIAWNRGLTKETDTRVKMSAASMRRHYAEHGHPNTGHNKHNDPRVAAKALKVSVSRKRAFAEGRLKTWITGLTKETDVRVAALVTKSAQTRRSMGIKFTDAHLEKLRRAKLLTEDVVIDRLKQHNVSLVDSYIDTMTPTTLSCSSCENVFVRTVGAVFNNNAKCPSCHPPWAIKTSKWQEEIYEFTNTLTSGVILNDRQALAGKELDIYVPDKRFAIECNGLYWHSEAVNRFSSNHVEEKRLLAKALGISLLVVFEDEWRDRRAVIESMIRHRVGKSATTGARKLTLSRCPVSEASKHLNEWHLEGAVPVSYALKLAKLDGSCIGACTLRWFRSKDTRVIEVARIAFSPNEHIQGAMSRFIHEARRWATELGAKRLLTYSDNRLGDGAGYAKAGMKPDKTTALRFWWTDFSRRHNRLKYRANKRRGLTEKQVANAAGVHHIYGCTNTRWVLDL